MSWFSQLFDTSSFPARWNCGSWSPWLGWTHIVSDAAIFAAYLAIPVVLLYFARRRKDLPYPWIVWMFAAFILSCGTGHLIESIIFYEPIYRFAGLWKLLTAAVSWITVIGLIPVIPKLLSLRSPRELQAEIDQREVVQERLERKNDELDQFAYVASHDLKAPIRAIGMSAQFIREDLEDREAILGHIETIERRARRMESLVSGLLEVARAGQVVGDLERFTIADLFADVRDSIGIEESRRIEVECEPLEMVTYRLGLDQVLTNLVVNGLTHSKSDTSKVRVTARRSASRTGFVEFVVEDDGPGVAPQYRDRVFGIFQTLEARDVFESTGVGLTIVKKLVDAVGGEIRVDDSELGGAAFHLLWPQEMTPESLADVARPSAELEPTTVGGPS